MSDIKLGAIYKRKTLDNYSLIGSYPKYIVLINEYETNIGKTYSFIDMEWDGTPSLYLPDYTIQDYYELVEHE